MVKIRLTRLGRHKTPFYRIVAVDSRKRRDSDYLALLGTFDPVRKEIKNYKEEQIITFLKLGAQPAETVRNILKKQGTWAKFLATKKTKPAKKAKRKLSKKKVAKKLAKKNAPKKAKVAKASPATAKAEAPKEAK